MISLQLFGPSTVQVRHIVTMATITYQTVRIIINIFYASVGITVRAPVTGNDCMHFESRTQPGFSIKCPYL